MKAVFLLGGWLAVGTWVAFRTQRPPGERALALLFWPFFLQGMPGASASAPIEPSLARLSRALGEGDAADDVVAELSRALQRLRGRRDRVQAELDVLGAAAAGPVADARARSRALLEAARDRLEVELARAEGAVEETATRLVLAGEAGEAGATADVGPLLEALRSRLSAAEELDPAVSSG